MIYILINEQLFPAVITGKLHDDSWDNRPSKEINVKMSYEEAVHLFTDNVQWSIVETIIHEETIMNENEEPEIVFNEEQNVYDNSDYSIVGDIIIHKNGTITVKMGKLTAEEMLAMIEEVL